MLVYALDDEPFLLAELEKAIAEAEPSAEIHSFSSTRTALAELSQSTVYPDVAFLDIEMPGMTGLELAKCIKERSPQTNIVFVTGFRQYAAEGAQLRMSGYVMKPVSAEKVKTELLDLRHPVVHKADKCVRVQCFGNFEVFVDGAPLHFGRNRTKELLAYLVDRQGASSTMGELMAILWEDKTDCKSQRSQLRNLIADLREILKEHGVESIIIKNRNELSIDPSQLECDYYRFIQGDMTAVNLYRGEYMSQYSWPEMRIPSLVRR